MNPFWFSFQLELVRRSAFWRKEAISCFSLFAGLNVVYDQGTMRFAEVATKSPATRCSIEWGSATTIIVGTLCVASKGDVIFQRSGVNPVDFSTFRCARVVDSWWSRYTRRSSCSSKSLVCASGMIWRFTSLAMDLHWLVCPSPSREWRTTSCPGLGWRKSAVVRMVIKWSGW